MWAARADETVVTMKLPDDSQPCVKWTTLGPWRQPRAARAAGRGSLVCAGRRDFEGDGAFAALGPGSEGGRRSEDETRRRQRGTGSNSNRGKRACVPGAWSMGCFPCVRSAAKGRGPAKTNRGPPNSRPGPMSLAAFGPRCKVDFGRPKVGPGKRRSDEG